MKKFLLLLLLSLGLYADTIMIDKINKTLQQLAYETAHKPHIRLDIKYDPFYHDKKAPAITTETKADKKVYQKRKKSLVLSMILNKKAFINGVWYKEKQKVAQYMLDKVNQDSVVLKRKNKIIVLKLKTTDKLLLKKEVL